jgi:hypothetical protein
MSFLASAADERVLDVRFSEDSLIVSLRDGRVISVPLPGTLAFSMLRQIIEMIGRFQAEAMESTGLT